MPMDDFKERILVFVRDYLGVSVRRFEESCGITNGTIGSIRGQGPTASVVSKIANTYPELSMDWLFRGVGEMLRGPEPKPATPAVSIGTIKTVNIGNWNELVELLIKQKKVVIK